MIIWIEEDLAMAIHDRQLAEHGGGAGVRDETLLKSALARPQQLAAYGDPAPDVCDLAASLAVGLARNHPFVDGNKRTAWVCCITFLALNGVKLNASVEEKFLAILGLAQGEMEESAFAKWLRDHSTGQISKSQINEPAANYS